MLKRDLKYPLVILCLIVLLTPASLVAGDSWWDVVPEDETPSPYYDAILYSEIAPKLREIQVNSNRVQV